MGHRFASNELVILALRALAIVLPIVVLAIAAALVSGGGADRPSDLVWIGLVR
jgi:hypothetical protein